MQNEENKVYSGSLTREQFLFREIKIVSKLVVDELSNEEILTKIYNENLFQYPTEKMVKNIVKVCLKRLENLDNKFLIDLLANGPFELAKEINLYAIMKTDLIVKEFMIDVIGEKLISHNYSFNKTDINAFFSELRMNSETVNNWSEKTINKMKQVLLKMLVDLGCLDNTKDENLKRFEVFPELVNEIRNNNDLIYLKIFDY